MGKGKLIIGLVTILLNGCTSSLQPGTSNNSARSVESWITYRNTEYGYIFQYPADLSLDMSNGQASPSVQLTNYNQATLTETQIKNPFWPGRLKVEFTVVTQGSEAPPTDNDLLEWVESRPRYAEDRIIEVMEPFHAVELDTAKAVAYSMVVSGTGDMNGLVKGWYVSLPTGDILAITGLIVPPTDEDLIAQLDRIAATFALADVAVPGA